jgi:hypothetical protein
VRNRAVYKRINGKVYKLCTGPLHLEGQFVIASNFYVDRRKNKKTTLYAQCKDCCAARAGNQRFVPADKYLPFLKALVWRIGKNETRRRLPMAESPFRAIYNGKTKNMRRSTAAKILIELRRVYDNDEVRSRTDILAGNHMRGREPTPPRPEHGFRDYYFQGSDSENSQRREKRKARQNGSS